MEREGTGIIREIRSEINNCRLRKEWVQRAEQVAPGKIDNVTTVS